MNKLDPFTFGKSPSAIYLAGLLNEIDYAKYRHWITINFNKYCTLLNSVEMIESSKSKRAIRALIREKFFEILKQKILPKKLESNLKSIMKIKYNSL